MVYREAPEVPLFYGNKNPNAFLNWIKVLEEYFQGRQLRGNSCMDYTKRTLIGDAQAWWNKVECQLYQHPPTWKDMKVLLKDKYVDGRDPFSPPLKAKEDHFAQYFSLTQGKLSVEQYANEFERLHYLCDFGKTLDFNQFLKGLHPTILKNMKKECKDMHEAFWEAIRVKSSIKCYRLQKAKMQEEKSLQTTKVPMVEPITEIIKANVEEQKQDVNGFPTNSNEVIDKTPPPDPINNGDLKTQAAKNQKQALKTWIWLVRKMNIRWI